MILTSGMTGGSGANRNVRALVFVVALAWGATLAVGCATTERLEPLDVTLVDLDLIDATLFESTLDAAVRISNDNPEPLILDGAVIRLELDGKKFGKGSFSEQIEIPRLDSVVQRFEMHLSHIAVATKIRGVIESKVVDYAITGKVYVVTPSGATKKLPIDKRGSIDLRGTPPGDLATDLDATVAVEE